jgi:hypothetical protein
MSTSLHLILDNLPPERLERALLFIQRTKPAYVNIAGGAQYDRAMQAVERVRAISPATIPMLRKLEDTGRHTRETAQEFYNGCIAPIKTWLQKNKVVYVCDNESSASPEYAKWTVDAMRLTKPDGILLAVDRSSTGTHELAGYQAMKPVYDELRTIAGIYSPNAYFTRPGGDNGGHLNRHKDAWKVAGWNMPTVIGEFGMAVDFNPGKGYRSIGMNGRDYANLIIKHYEDWYKKDGVTVCLYCMGGFGWESFQLGDDVLETLEAYAAKQPPIVVTPPPPVADPIPPRVYTPALAYLKNGAAMVNLRSEKSTAPGTDIGDILAADRIKYAPLEGGWWPIIHIAPDGRETAGFASDLYFEPTPMPVPPPKPEPPAPPTYELVFTLPKGTTPEMADALGKMFASAKVRLVQPGELKKAS